MYSCDSVYAFMSMIVSAWLSACVRRYVCEIILRGRNCNLSLVEAKSNSPTKTTRPVAAHTTWPVAALLSLACSLYTVA